MHIYNYVQNNIQGCFPFIVNRSNISGTFKTKVNGTEISFKKFPENLKTVTYHCILYMLYYTCIFSGMQTI